jgi:DNA/RNA endonuclease YhcR with UshA esterase domain
MEVAWRLWRRYKINKQGKVEEVGGRCKGYKKKNEILVRDRMDIKELSVGF